MSLLKAVGLLGFDLKDEKDFDEAKFKEYVDKTYITRDAALKDDEIHKSYTGRILQPVTRQLKKLYDLKDDEVKDKTFDELLTLSKAKTDAAVKALEEKIGKTDDQKVLALTTEIEKEKMRAADLEKALQTKEQEYTGKIGELTTGLKTLKLTQKVNEVKGKVQFIDEFKTDEIKRAGFDAIINQKYAVDLDDKEELVVTSKADGKPVMNPKKSGHFATLLDVLENEAEAAKLLKKNNAPDSTTFKTRIKTGDNVDGKVVDMARVHPNAIKNAERLRNQQ